MQQVVVQIDWYTKFVLALIAVLLAGILVKVNIVSRPAGASEEAKAMPVEITRVNLKRGGSSRKVTRQTTMPDVHDITYFQNSRGLSKLNNT